MDLLLIFLTLIILALGYQLLKNNYKLNSVYNEMSNITTLFSNNKTRGTIGEILLERILLNHFSSLYEKNFKPDETKNIVVEFAFRVKVGEDLKYLVIDSKFPTNKETESSLVSSVKSYAKDISKYLDNQVTLPFGIMFIPSETLYLEIISTDNLVEDLFQKHRVLVVNSTNLVALLTTLSFILSHYNLETSSKDILLSFDKLSKNNLKIQEAITKQKKKLEEAITASEDVEKQFKQINKELIKYEKI